MAHDLDRFVGLPYCPRRMDCADLVLLVQRELFGRAVKLPGKRARPLHSDAQAQALASYVAELGRPVTEPRDGDAVLMRDAGAAVAGHIGTFFSVNFAPHVLHTSHALGASVLHRVRDLPGLGLRIEGYYTWI